MRIENIKIVLIQTLAVGHTRLIKKQNKNQENQKPTDRPMNRMNESGEVRKGRRKEGKKEERTDFRG